MNYKVKKIFTNVRVIILLVFLVLAIVAINPRLGAEGIVIRNVMTNSSATEAGIQQPPPTVKPVDRERILAIDNRPINNVEDYYNYVNTFEPNKSIQIKTNKGLYRLTTREDVEIIELNEKLIAYIWKKTKGIGSRRCLHKFKRSYTGDVSYFRPK